VGDHALSPAENRRTLAEALTEDGALRRVAVSGCQLLLVLTVFGVWEILARRDVVSPQFIGQPSLILEQFVAVARDGSLVEHTSITLAETFLGFSLGILLGLACGLLLWWSDFLSDVLNGFIVMFNSTPRIVFAPVLIILIGIGFNTKVVLSFLSVFAVAWLNIFQGTRAVDLDLIRLLRSMGATRWQIFTRVVIPTSLPWLISTLKLCIGLALIGAIVGEYIAARKGLGYLIFYASSVYEMNLVWAGVFVLMLVSFVLYLLIERIERRLLRWMTP
jgi:NitT/TauT family transport system permease protein